MLVANAEVTTATINVRSGVLSVTRMKARAAMAMSSADDGFARKTIVPPRPVSMALSVGAHRAAWRAS